MRRTASIILATLWFPVALAFAGTEEAPLSFRYDVMPVLTKAGCNMGACHGAQTGKGELALSLRGESPALDYERLSSKWLNVNNPEASLFLRKPTMAIKHEGGLRFTPESESYQILLKWLQQGAPLGSAEEPVLTGLDVTPAEKVLFDPEKEVHLQVTAKWSDGSTRDVSRWAIFEPSNLIVEVGPDGKVDRLQPGETTVNVRYLGIQKPARLMFVPARPGYEWAGPAPRNFIDRHIQKKLQLVRTNPSPRCDDATFVRRVYLDLTGVIPTADQAKAFVANPAPDKRAQLVETLLETGEFADFWALKWADLLRVEDKLLDRTGVKAFHGFIRDKIANHVPMDQFAREVLTGRGSTYQNGAANFYRALRDPASRAEAVAQVFLGSRLGCAKCHNHPYESWTMNDYYQFAAVFDGIDYRIVENKRNDKSDRNMFIGEQIVLVDGKSEFKDPRTDAAPQARLLGAKTLPADPTKDRFRVLADWLTAPENPLFARVQTNRIWYHLMGRGLVDPVDDFRSTNPPSHPELLDELTAHFVKNRFDLRGLIRLITDSEAYQTASEPSGSNADDELNFSHAPIRRLSAEQMLDSIHLSMKVPATFDGFTEVMMRAAQLPGTSPAHRGGNPTPGDRFLALFGKPPRLTNSDLERTEETSLAQVFELISGATLQSVLSTPKNRLGQLLNAEVTDAERIETLYWTVLSRAPNAAELEALQLHVKSSATPRDGYEDIAWSLLNSKEFLLRR